MAIEDLTEAVRERVGGASISGVLKFDLGDAGVIRIDGTQSPPVVDNSDGDADCTIKVSEEDFRDIMEGRQNAQMAFMMGKLKVEGNMGLAMQLAGSL